MPKIKYERSDRAAEKISGIYIIINIVDGTSYVGASSNCVGRMKHHLDGRGSQELAADIERLGRGSFIGFVIHETSNLREEFAWIDRLKPEYNLMTGSGHSEGTKAKISRSRTGKGLGTMTPERARRISEAKKGTKPSAATIEASRRARLGSKHSPETRAKMSASHRARMSDFF